MGASCVQNLLVHTERVIAHAQNATLLGRAWQGWRVWWRHLRQASARAAAACLSKDVGLLGRTFALWAQYARAMQSDIDWRSPFLLAEEVSHESTSAGRGGGRSPEQLRAAHQQLSQALHERAGAPRSLSPQVPLSPAQLLQQGRQ